MNIPPKYQQLQTEWTDKAYDLAKSLSTDVKRDLGTVQFSYQGSWITICLVWDDSSSLSITYDNATVGYSFNKLESITPRTIQELCLLTINLNKNYDDWNNES